MRKVTLVRWGIGAALAAMGAFGVMAAGCSGDDDNNPTPGTDAGKDTSTTPDTSTGEDTGTGEDSGTDGGVVKEANARIILVHASPDVPAIRLCFGTGKKADGSDQTVNPSLVPLPNTVAGLGPGQGGPLPELIDLRDVAITGYAILASKITDVNPDAGAAEKGCGDLIGPKGQGGTLKPGVDYIPLKTIEAGTFQHNTTYLLAAVGCLPNVGDAGVVDPTANAAKCGADFDATKGNINVTIAKLEAPVDAGAGIGAQFAHRASAVEGLAAPSGVLPFFAYQVATDAGASDAGDAGDDAGDAAPATTTAVVPISATLVKYGSLTAPAVVNVPLANPSKTYFGVRVPSAVDGGAPTDIALPLSAIQLLSIGPPAPDAGVVPYFVPGKTFTFIALGDPTAAAPGTAGYDGHGVHFVAFPNDVPAPKL